jgi:single-strand DNA-binding protein
MNKVLLIGRLGRDPEMRYAPSGKPVTTFSLATSRSYLTDDGERREATEWFNVVAWRRLAEICHARLSRGSRVYIEGRLQTRAWDDPAGRHQQRVEVVAHEMLILDGGPAGFSSVHGTGERRPAAAYESEAPDDYDASDHHLVSDEKGEERDG